jgi:hypothetical protein
MEQANDIQKVMSPEQELSFGMKLVGINFNPSGDVKVHRAKELCAQLADLLHQHYTTSEGSQLQTQLYNHAIGEVLNAQMNVVKVLTLKH